MTFSAYAANELRRYFHDTRIDHRSPQIMECPHHMFNEYLEQKVHITFPRCRVDKIRQVLCRQMYGMYLLRKEEMLLEKYQKDNSCQVQERILYHVTTQQKGLQSLENGLDWRRTKRSRYGQGVSFSDDADYADYYANHSAGDEKRVIIVCTVLVSKTSTVRSHTARNNKVCVPPGNTDTTMSPNGRVYVKYNDYEFYPLYLVYYQRPDPCLSYYFNDGSNNNKPRQNRSVEAFAAGQLQKQQQEQKQLSEQMQQQEQFRRCRDEKLRQQQLLWDREEHRRLEQRRFEQRQFEQRLFEQRQLEQRQNRQPSYNREVGNNCLIL